MIDNTVLDQLRHKGESADLDFKQAQYPFVGASDHQKSELLKDILAMANAYREGAGYILIGIKDCAPHPAEVVGISPSDHLDDASIQQFVHSKVDPQLSFSYEERMFEGEHIAVITIPKQPRPFALLKDYGRLRQSVVYVRRGSATGEASMDEIKKMALADAGAALDPNVVLHIDDETNEPLPCAFELEFLEFGELPDYEERDTIDLGNGIRMPMHTMSFANRHFYRESAEYHTAIRRLIQIRLSVSNQANISLDEVKVELVCAPADGNRVDLMRADHLPDEPESSSYGYLGHLPSMIDRLRERVVIDERGRTPVCHFSLGTLRPGETGRADTDVAVLPSGPGDYFLHFKIFAKKIQVPIVVEHPLSITGPVRKMDMDELLRLIYAKHFDRAEDA